MAQSIKTPKKKWLSEFLPIILVFAVVILLSEFIYKYSHDSSRPNPVSFFYLALARNQLNKNEIDTTSIYLNKTAYFYIKENNRLFKDKIPVEPINVSLENVDDKTRLEILDLLKESLPRVGNEKSVLHLSNVYYNIGLILFFRNYHVKSQDYFQTAILLNPELGFLHLELANGYLYDGYLEKAIDTLNFCLEFEAPRESCNSYLENNIKTRTFNPVGIYKEVISKNQGYTRNNSSNNAY